MGIQRKEVYKKSRKQNRKTMNQKMCRSKRRTNTRQSIKEADGLDFGLNVNKATEPKEEAKALSR